MIDVHTSVERNWCRTVTDYFALFCVGVTLMTGAAVADWIIPDPAKTVIECPIEVKGE